VKRSIANFLFGTYTRRRIIKAILAPFWERSQDVIPSRIFFKKSYSQDGEDVVLHSLIGSKRTGLYVDVGAYHSKWFSNTYMFYQQGWSGINIDATPGSMLSFLRDRPRDINIEAAVGTSSGQMTFYMFNAPALNTFDRDLMRKRIEKNKKNVVVKEQPISLRTLADVLSEHLAPHQTIDFLSVDVEGLDLDVLHSNDWESFRPAYILTESLGADIKNLEENDVHRFLTTQNYQIVAKTLRTLVYREQKPPNNQS
jgi:FkbM family methyltransferase